MTNVYYIIEICPRIPIKCGTKHRHTYLMREDELQFSHTISDSKLFDDAHCAKDCVGRLMECHGYKRDELKIFKVYKMGEEGDYGHFDL